MKHLLVIFISLITAATALVAKAGEVSTAQVSYLPLDDTTYRVFIKFFRFCEGSGEPNTMDLCVYNSCTNQTVTMTLQKWNGPVSAGNNGDVVKYTCGEYSTKCTQPNATIPGIREWWY